MLQKPTANSRTEMTWGYLDSHQSRAVTPFITGKEVYDLGAGYCILSERLIELGASKVIAVDKGFPQDAKRNKRIKHIEKYFADLVTDKKFNPEIVFISWPINNPSSDLLAEIVKLAKITIYLGTNFGGSQCGSRRFFEELSRRNLLSYVPHRTNNLIIVSDEIVDRPLTPEESAILNSSRIVLWEEAHGK
jgi:hypothetical protein